MNKEEMLGMMGEMMEQMCAGMTSDEKKEMMTGMMGMMGKMKEGAGGEETMPGTGAKEGPGGMQAMMAKMKGGGAQQSAMPEMMLKNMMPHCLKMLMPKIAQDRRAELVSGLIATLMEQASSGMSDDQKAALAAKAAETIKA